MKPIIAILTLLLVVVIYHPECSYASSIGDSSLFEVSKTTYPVQCEICGEIGSYVIITERWITAGYSDIIRVEGLETWVKEPWITCHSRCLRKVLKDVGLIKKKYGEFNEKNGGGG